MKISTKLLVQVEKYLRLETIDKLTVVTTFMIVALVVFALGTSAIFFLSMSLVEAISSMIGNSALAYLIVGVFLLLLIWLFLANKKAWVEDKVVRSMSENILNEPMFTGDDSVLDLDEDADDEETNCKKGGSGL